MDLSLAKNNKMVLFDVDGVMTDGSIFMSDEGELLKSFNVKDGLAIELLHSHGFITGVISGKTSNALTRRCKELGFDITITGCKNKLPELSSLCEKYKVNLDEIAFCGDDILDVPVFEHVGLAVAPSDAYTLALESADWIMNACGGKGMVREFTDILITSKFGCNLKEAYQPLLNKIQSNNLKGIEQ
jgi:3-deoxy-D-manno-octulosonate 8-phosphate phosphatase (KDO 8-P phosphatase)